MIAFNIGVVTGASIIAILITCLVGAKVLSSRLSDNGRSGEVEITVPHLVAIKYKVNPPTSNVEGDRPPEDPSVTVIDLQRRRPHIRAP